MAAITYSFGGLTLQTKAIFSLCFRRYSVVSPVEAPPLQNNLGSLGKEAEFHFAPTMDKCYPQSRIRAPKRSYPRCSWNNYKFGLIIEFPTTSRRALPWHLTNMENPIASTSSRPNAFIFAGSFFAVTGWIANSPPNLWVGLFFVAVGVGEHVVATIRK